MDNKIHNQSVNFIWSIADDVLRDVFVRGKYRDIILPFTVLRRLDALLVPSKEEVLKANQFLIKNKIDDKSALQSKSGYPFFNTSRFTFETLLNDADNIDSNLEDYLDGFSTNVQEIISKFKLRNQLETMRDAGITYMLVEKFASKDINLSPLEAKNSKGEILPPLTNLGMGYLFEELIRRFNEENNEEAGEHFTPRDIIRLMTHIVFLPVKEKIKKGTYLFYDPASGSGGMLTESEQFAKEITGNGSKFILYGQEINPETYAICTSDMLIKGEQPENIKYGSTLSKDGFPNLKFDFMLSNPPYGKTWKTDQDSITDGKGVIKDSRFAVGVPRVSDGQLLFLVNMISKMKHNTKLGSRIASVHNGSALFTGDAGSGESEIRRWMIESDLVECIVQLPNNMFYNTGISTYLWFLTNRKPEDRKGKIQLIDASNIYQKMRKSLGDKSNELSAEQIDFITQTYLDFKETVISRIFDNADFGYYKITVERPLRLSFQLNDERFKAYESNPHFDKGGKGGFSDDKIKPLYDKLKEKFGAEIHSNFNEFSKAFDKAMKDSNIKLSAKDRKEVVNAFTWKDENAKPVIKKKTKDEVEYEPDSDLRDYENIPLKQDIEEYFKTEVLPYVPDAWIDHSKTVTGYEIGFTKIFFKYQPLRSLEEITADIVALEKETEGILKEIITH